MNTVNRILSKKELQLFYGQFWKYGGKTSIRPNKVPEQYRILIPYAEFWGTDGDLDLWDLVKKAPKHVLENLAFVIKKYDDPLDDWLAGDEADSKYPTDEYVAFSALRMAYDFTL